jgi:ubiquinone/menaquinone biosynthesis C-methylase UbiE
MNLTQRFTRAFFRLLYHPFAFTYDLVAAAVSFNQWKNWIFSILPLIEGTHTLELGHGPGHLQRILLNQGLVTFAIDESAQMGKLAKRRLGDSHNLIRALAQQIPFADESFNSVIATFPTEYIFDGQTLSGIKRVLRKDGKLIVLLAAWPKSRILAWLFKITEQTPSEAYDSIKTKIKKSLTAAELKPEIQIIEVKSGNLFVVIAQQQESQY